MKKKVLLFALFSILIVTLMACRQDTSSLVKTEGTEGYYTYTVTDGKAAITNVDPTISGDVTIPSTLGGYPVTSIGVAAFVGDGVIYVGEDGGAIGWFGGPFYHCRALTSVTIPNSVTYIRENSFNECTNLTSITVEAGNTVYHSAGNCIVETESKTLLAGCKTSVIPNDGSVTSIGSSAFKDCTGLTSITIPDSVTSIGDYAFMACTGLTSITIPDSATSIGDYAFSNCTGLTSITIPDSVTSISDYAFDDCTGLTSITIPDSVTSIGSSAFSGCTGLTSITVPFVGASAMGTSDTHFGYIFGASSNDYEPPSNVDYVPSSLREVVITGGTSIDIWAFYGCTSLRSVTISDSATSIGGCAFEECSGLISITIPDGVTWIADESFSYCTSLTSITIPDSVTEIGYRAFNNCTGLKTVYYKGTQTKWDAISFWGDYADPTYCGAELIFVTDIPAPGSSID